jgi:hypothetical protein
MSPNTRPLSPRSVHTAGEGAERQRREAGEGSPPLALPDRPSIAVLPFANMSGDPEQEYFADGMVEEIITALSRIRWLFVIARNSSFIYKGQAIEVKQVAAGQSSIERRRRHRTGVTGRRNYAFRRPPDERSDCLRSLPARLRDGPIFGRANS